MNIYFLYFIFFSYLLKEWKIRSKGRKIYLVRKIRSEKSAMKGKKENTEIEKERNYIQSKKKENDFKKEVLYFISFFHTHTYIYIHTKFIFPW